MPCLSGPYRALLSAGFLTADAFAKIQQNTGAPPLVCLYCTSCSKPHGLSLYCTQKHDFVGLKAIRHVNSSADGYRITLLFFA